ncbi:uncharacterized protein LOC125053927 [Pieris napi]|uniref:uncharacterized protein LOC125053927 n=1 Tax=Pieris napi TaxID=78633 RepID=UPI001FB930B9|nr:uncharacterized protein LOC125053927 [Pieris napi]
MLKKKFIENVFSLFTILVYKQHFSFYCPEYIYINFSDFLLLSKLHIADRERKITIKFNEAGRLNECQIIESRLYLNLNKRLRRHIKVFSCDCSIMDDPYISCPYNAYHRVPRSRIQRHLTKCPDFKSDWAFCPFDHSHRMPQNDLAEHMKECKLGTQMGKQLFYQPAFKQPLQKQKQQNALDDEIWD